MEGLYQEIPAQGNHVVIYQLFSGIPTEEYSYTVKIHIADIIFSYRHRNTKGNCRKVRDIPTKEIPTEETPTKEDCMLFFTTWELGNCSKPVSGITACFLLCVCIFLIFSIVLDYIIYQVLSKILQHIHILMYSNLLIRNYYSH